jgi:ribosomal protein S18 acetylase RimI-like enzyme
MSLAFRAFREEDLEAVIALWRACDILWPHRDPAREVARVREAADAELILAFEGDRLAGSVQVGHDGHRAWMYRLAVDPGFRRRGCGRALVARAEAWALAQRIPKLMLLIRDSNEAVARFYSRLGFAEEPRMVMSKTFAAGTRPGAGSEIPVVITYLEMTAQPSRPTVPMPAGLKLALLRVERPSIPFYRFLYDQVGAPWFWYERKQMPDGALREIITDPKVELYVPYVAGAPAGYVEIDRRPAPDVSLAYFGLMPGYFGVGLGWYLLNWAIDAAWTGAPRRLIVDTCTLDHPRALQTYQRAGFRAYRQERRSIVDPRLSGRTPSHFEPRLP